VTCDGLTILAREFRNDKVSFVSVLIRTFCDLGFDVSIDSLFIQKGLIVLLECFGVDPFLFPLSTEQDGFTLHYFSAVGSGKR
jgi:hypothetical protein